MNNAAAQEHGLEIVMRVDQAHRRELLQTLEQLRGTVVGENRVAACEVLEDSVVPNRFFWVERWLSEEEVRASLTSDRIAMLLAAIRLLGSIETVRRARVTAEPPSTSSNEFAIQDLDQYERGENQ